MRFANIFLTVFALLIPLTRTAAGESKHSACGLEFRAKNWLVTSDRGGDDQECVVSVRPPGLTKLLEQDLEEVDDGPPRVVDRYTVSIFVTREPAEQVEETFFWQNHLNPQIRHRGGWRIAENRDHSDRMYFQKGGYCCVSWMPAAIMSKGDITVVVIAGAKSAAVFDEIVASMRKAPRN